MSIVTHTLTFFVVVALLINSFFLGIGNGITVLKFKKLCTCDHSLQPHLEEDHSNDSSQPHFCPRHKTKQKLENQSFVYPFHVVTTTLKLYLVYDVLFLIKPYPYPLLDAYIEKLLRPPKTRS